MIDSTQDEMTAEELADVQETFTRLCQNQHDRLGPLAGKALLWVTQAMVDHETGAGRGITAKTWQRWMRQMIEGDIMDVADVLHRLTAKAHWQPPVAA